MHEYYFANYRLLVDDAISRDDSMEYLAGFSKEMPTTHTFIFHLGDETLLETKMAEATACPIVCTTDTFNIHDTQNMHGLSSRCRTKKTSSTTSNGC